MFLEVRALEVSTTMWSHDIFLVVDNFRQKR